jgi:hypothetical protein
VQRATRTRAPPAPGAAGLILKYPPVTLPLLSGFTPAPPMNAKAMLRQSIGLRQKIGGTHSLIAELLLVVEAMCQRKFKTTPLQILVVGYPNMGKSRYVCYDGFRYDCFVTTAFVHHRIYTIVSCPHTHTHTPSPLSFPPV